MKFQRAPAAGCFCGTSQVYPWDERTPQKITQIKFIDPKKIKQLGLEEAIVVSVQKQRGILAEYSPFYDDNPFGIYEKILTRGGRDQRETDPVAKDLIKKFLALDRSKRMGNMKNGADDVKRHRWFKNLNWNDVLNNKIIVIHIFI